MATTTNARALPTIVGALRPRRAKGRRRRLSLRYWSEARDSSPTPLKNKSTNKTVTDDELEARLAKLRTAKGATPDAEKKKQPRGTPAPSSSAAAAAAKTDKPAAPAPSYDFSSETLYYEGPPHRGDLATNLALGATLVWLPLTAAAVGRAAFVTYRFTDRRLSVVASAPWKKEQTDVAYQEVKDVKTVPRGIGLWGDMVVTLRNGDKVEIRSLDRFKELKDYILERRDALAPAAAGGAGGGGKSGGGKAAPGKASRVAAMTDLDTPLPSEAGAGKGFSSWGRKKEEDHRSSSKTKRTNRIARAFFSFPRPKFLLSRSKPTHTKKLICFIPISLSCNGACPVP
jgi:hypothetical protein